jgi:hypothetical protein
MTAEDRAATTQVSRTLKFKEGRYELGMPWKDGEPKLDNNFEAAMCRLESQERSLKRKGPEIMKAYGQIFEDYKKKGYIKQVPKSATLDQ